MLIANKLLDANKGDDIHSDDKSIEKCEKLLMCLKLFKLGNSKGKKSAKSKKPLKSGN